MSSLPPEELLKGLLGERATGCWEAELELELELNGLGKSETPKEGGGGGRRQEIIHSVLGEQGTFLTIQTHSESQSN